MKNALVVFLSILSLLFLVSCGDDEVNETVLTGKVVNIVNNQPIEGVLVSTVPSTNSVLTDSKGNFTISDVVAGNYFVNVSKYGYYSNATTVKINNGKTTSVIIQMYDSASANHAPEKPTLITPQNNARINKFKTNLTWSCEDIDGDELSYELYFGIGETPNELIYSGSEKSKLIENLVHNQLYSWKVIAKDKYGSNSTSEIFKFNVDTSRPPSLILHFPLNGNINNISTYSFNISSQNLTYAVDRKGNSSSCAYFNSNSYIKILSDTNLNTPDAFTASFWVKPGSGFNSLYSGYIILLGRWNSYGTGNLNASYNVAIDLSQKRFNGGFHNGSFSSFCYANSSVSEGTWYHVALTYENSEQKIYINGVLSNIVSSCNPQKSKYDMIIGAENTSFDHSFKGWMDDIRIYNTALSGDAIQALANE